jgi:aldehyde:ferredoxin oxidoreductase
MFRGGYTGRVLRVDLSTRKTSIETIDRNDQLMLLGGRGLAAKYYAREVGPRVDPFDEENKVFFFTGPLTGTALPSTTKFQLATKSPNTGIYQCSNSSGEFGPQLKRCGFDGLIIEGRSEDWSYLIIKDEKVTFGDAKPWQGFHNTETQKVALQVIDEKGAGALSIGPAGERLVRIAFVNVDSRAFGRGGAGAVLGSKKLKAIAVHGTGDIPVNDPERIREIRIASTKNLKETRAGLTEFGTMNLIAVMNELGCLPTRNFQSATFEGADRVDAEAMKADYWKRNYGCFRCPLACGKVVEAKDGPYAGTVSRAEYESVALLGPNCGVSDFGAVIKACELCDELGMDTMSTGHAVALTMELFERGLITEADTDGIEARFGSGEALVELIALIAERRAIGDLLAEGMGHVKKLKPEWAPYILEVKGLPLAAYDPRGFHGKSLTYGTSSRGACHNVGGWTVADELLSGKVDRYALEGKGALVKGLQDERAFVDSLGICGMVRFSMGFTREPEGDVTKAVTGHDFTPDLMEIGSRIYTLERLIITREGISRKDDTIPRRISEDPLPSGPAEGRAVTKEMYNRMLDDYYDHRGWDRDGVPLGQTVRSLSLEALPS